MNVGIGAATLRPQVATSAVAMLTGLLREFARGNGPRNVTVLASAEVCSAFAELASEHLSFVEYSPGAWRRKWVPRPVGLAAGLWTKRPGSAFGAPDVVHYPVTVPIPRAVAPTVVTLHDVLHHDQPRSLSAAVRVFRRRAYDKPARSATIVATGSEFAKSRIAEQLGIPEQRIAVVPLAVGDGFAPQPALRDESLLDGLALPDSFVYYPADFWLHKNHERLLEALREVSEPGLALVTSGHELGRGENVLGAARRLQVADRFHYLGHVPREAVPALYRRARAVVFPSLYEGFGIPLLEAMASGCPVACADRASLPEVAGGAAIYFDPIDPVEMANAIDVVAGDERRRHELREAGLERAKEFTWATAARDLTRIYEMAAGRSG